MTKISPSFSPPFEVYTFTGKVADVGKNMETRVHGGGGGGGSYRGTGSTAPVHISSTTVIHDQLFLIDDEGSERSFQLEDMNVACRIGNMVSICWGIPENKDKGPFIAALNHSTQMEFFQEKGLRSLYINKTIQIILILAGIGLWMYGSATESALGFFGWVAIGFAIFRWWKGKAEIKAFKNAFKYELSLSKL